MPTLAVVHGPAIAGGFGIVLACDLVLATPAAKFALPEVKRGISPAVVSPLLLYRIGHGPAMPLLLEGGTINGDEAYRLGLCHYLAPAEQLAERRRELVAALLGGRRRRWRSPSGSSAASPSIRSSTNSKRDAKSRPRPAVRAKPAKDWPRSARSASRSGSRPAMLADRSRREAIDPHCAAGARRIQLTRETSVRDLSAALRHLTPRGTCFFSVRRLRNVRKRSSIGPPARDQAAAPP